MRQGLSQSFQHILGLLECWLPHVLAPNSVSRAFIPPFEPSLWIKLPTTSGIQKWPPQLCWFETHLARTWISARSRHRRYDGLPLHKRVALQGLWQIILSVSNLLALCGSWNWYSRFNPKISMGAVAMFKLWSVFPPSSYFRIVWWWKSVGWNTQYPYQASRRSRKSDFTDLFWLLFREWYLWCVANMDLGLDLTRGSIHSLYHRYHNLPDYNLCPARRKGVFTDLHFTRWKVGLVNRQLGAWFDVLKISEGVKFTIYRPGPVPQRWMRTRFS